MYKLLTVNPVSTALREAIGRARPKMTLARIYRDNEATATREGLTYAIMRNMVNGRTVPTEEAVDIIRKALKLPATWPTSELGKKKEGRLVSVTGMELAPIKIVGSASAGAGSYNVDSHEGEIYVPYSLAQIGGLGWLVEGDSMMPDLEPGMVAIFREWRQTRPDFTFLVKSPSGELRVKNLVYRRSGWMLESINPSFEPEPLGSHELLGFLIGWYRVKGKRETMDSDPDGLILRQREFA